VRMVFPIRLTSRVAVARAAMVVCTRTRSRPSSMSTTYCAVAGGPAGVISTLSLRPSTVTSGFAVTGKSRVRPPAPQPGSPLEGWMTTSTLHVPLGNYERNCTARRKGAGRFPTAAQDHAEPIVRQPGQLEGAHRRLHLLEIDSAVFPARPTFRTAMAGSRPMRPG